MKESDTDTIIDSLGILARNVKTDDGVANALIAEAAMRMVSLNVKLAGAKALLSIARDSLDAEQRQAIDDFLDLSK